MNDDPIAELTDLARADVWRLWNALPDGYLSPVKAIALILDLPAEVVADIVLPADTFYWAEDEEPEPTARRVGPELYGLICDAVWRGDKGLPPATADDRFLHTSDKCRAIANRIMGVLEAEGLVTEVASR